MAHLRIFFNWLVKNHRLGGDLQNVRMNSDDHKLQLNV